MSAPFADFASLTDSSLPASNERRSSTVEFLTIFSTLGLETAFCMVLGACF